MAGFLSPLSRILPPRGGQQRVHLTPALIYPPSPPPEAWWPESATPITDSAPPQRGATKGPCHPRLDFPPPSPFPRGLVARFCHPYRRFCLPRGGQARVYLPPALISPPPPGPWQPALAIPIAASASPQGGNQGLSHLCHILPAGACRHGAGAAHAGPQRCAGAAVPSRVGLLERGSRARPTV